MANDQTKAAPAQMTEDEFIQWFSANYHGTVEFLDGAWHAKSIYRRLCGIRLIAERDALAAKLAEAVDALRPFAMSDLDLGDLGDEPDDSAIYMHGGYGGEQDSTFSVGDLRRADAIVKEHE